MEAHLVQQSMPVTRKVDGSVDVTIDDLRTGIRTLASETCTAWQLNRQKLQPTLPLSTEQPRLETPRRWRRWAKRAVFVFAGGVIVGVDEVAHLHQVIPSEARRG
jgi:hypothetical protein